MDNINTASEYLELWMHLSSEETSKKKKITIWHRKHRKKGFSYQSAFEKLLITKIEL